MEEEDGGAQSGCSAHSDMVTMIQSRGMDNSAKVKIPVITVKEIM
jgi:hypothetical protein